MRRGEQILQEIANLRLRRDMLATSLLSLGSLGLELHLLSKIQTVVADRTMRLADFAGMSVLPSEHIISALHNFGDLPPTPVLIAGLVTSGLAATGIIDFCLTRMHRSSQHRQISRIVLESQHQIHDPNNRNKKSLLRRVFNLEETDNRLVPRMLSSTLLRVIPNPMPQITNPLYPNSMHPVAIAKRWINGQPVV